MIKDDKTFFFFKKKSDSMAQWLARLSRDTIVVDSISNTTAHVLNALEKQFTNILLRQNVCKVGIKPKTVEMYWLLVICA